MIILLSSPNGLGGNEGGVRLVFKNKIIKTSPYLTHCVSKKSVKGYLRSPKRTVEQTF